MLQTLANQVIRPADETDFEIMCARVYGFVLGDPTPKRMGRRGQNQAGVDILLNPSSGRIGVQCKKYKDGGLSMQIINADIEKAEKAALPITRLIFVTTAANDARIVQQVMALSDDRAKRGLFTVDIEFWDAICEHVIASPVLRELYAPTSGGAVLDRVETSHEQIHAKLDLLLQRPSSVPSELQAPAGRDDSLNRLITSQLDAINEKLVAGRYRDAYDQLAEIARAFDQFDAHQKARWYVERGICRIHLGEPPKNAAVDYLEAAELYPDDEKIAAAKVRGLALQEKVDEALAYGRDAMHRFPASIALWLAGAQATINAGRSITEIGMPPGSGDRAEVLQMLAWSAWQQDRFGEAVNYASRAIRLVDATLFTRSTFLICAVSLATSNAVAHAFDFVDETARAAVHEAVAQFEPRSERLWSSQSRATLPDDAATLAYAYSLLGDHVQALQVLDEAGALVTPTTRMVSVRANILRTLGRTDELLHVAAQSIGKIDRAAIMPVLESAAIAGATELASQLVATLPAGLSDDDVAGAHTFIALAQFQAGDREGALEAIRATLPGMKTAMPLLISARMLLAGGHKAEASVIADHISSIVGKDGSAEQRIGLADILANVGRFAEAARIYEAYAPPKVFSDLHVKLLRAYVLGGERHNARRLLDGFPVAWSQNDDARAYAIELANQTRDVARLVPLAKLEIGLAPTQAAPWLLHLYAELHASASVAEFQALVRSIPEDLEGTPRQIAQLAAQELRFGAPERAVQRLYKMHRSRLTDPEAVTAYMMVLLGAEGPLPCMGEVDVVVAGTACAIVDCDGNRTWLVIDPKYVKAANPAPGFVGADSVEARALLGKRVGEQVDFPGTFGAQTATIFVATTAEKRLFEMAMERASSPFERLPHVGSVRVLKDDGTLDFSAMEAMIKSSTERRRTTFELYDKQPVTLGILARALGVSPMELVVEWPYKHVALRVCIGTAAERAGALQALHDASAVVIDLATIAELVRCDCETVLEALPKVYVGAVSQQTIRAALEEQMGGNQPFAHATEVDGQLRIFEYGEEYIRGRREFLQRVQRTVEQYCEVRPAYGSENLPKEVLQLDGRLGDEEYEALLLTHEHGATMLSTDARLRQICEVFLKVKTAFPQVLAMYGVDKGRLVGAQYFAATTVMYLTNRSHISVNAQALLWMCEQGGGTMMDGLSRFRTEIASGVSEFVSAVDVCNDFLSLVPNFMEEFGVLLQLTEYLYEAIFRHSGCPSEFDRVIPVISRQLVGHLEPDVPAHPFFAERRQQARQALEDAMVESLKQAKERSHLEADAPTLDVQVVKVFQQPRLVLRHHGSA